MRANAAVRRLGSRDSAEVGVGTLIIFIAMVLVAAVAAAVIIGTSGDLQQRAQTTGKEAITEVTSNFRVLGVYGVRNDTSSDIWTVDLTAELSSGASNVPMNQMIMRFSDGHTETIYRYGSSPAFTLSWIRGAGTDQVMKPGDLVQISFNVPGAALPVKSSFQVFMIPAVGNSVDLSLTTPATYNSAINVEIQ